MFDWYFRLRSVFGLFLNWSGLPVELSGLLVFFAILMVLLWLTGKVPVMYNISNLWIRWITTSLTMGAYILVIALLVAMMSFVNGMYALTSNSGQPGNVMILAEGATDEGFSNLGFADVGDIENQPGIERIVHPVTGREQPLCSRESYIVVNQQIEEPQPGRPRRRFLSVRGVVDPWISGKVHSIPLIPGGEWFSEAGVRTLPGRENELSAIEVVLGEGIAGELGRDRSPEELAKAKNPGRLDAGDTFPIGNRTWLVVGVMQAQGTTFNSEVWAKQSQVGEMFSKRGYTTLVARTKGKAEAEKLRKFFKEEYQKSALGPQLEVDYFSNLSTTNLQFLVAIIIVTAVMSLGGVFGVMNTMFAAISQREKDIGVLRMLGYRRTSILKSFLLESLLLAMIGGLIGCLFGSFADGWTANSVVSSGPGGGGKFVVLRMTVDWTTLALGMVMAMLMGFFGGLIPSLSAMRLSALDALR